MHLQKCLTFGVHIIKDGRVMFFKKELCSTYDINLYRQITDTLSQHSIKFSSVTNYPFGSDRYRGIPQTSAINMMYVYRIFVSRKDFESAKQLLEKSQ